MNKLSYLNEVQNRIIEEIVSDLKLEGHGHNLVKATVDLQFERLKKKFFPGEATDVRPTPKDRLIKLFMFEKPYSLKYWTLGRQRAQWKADKVVLDELIREGSVKVVDRGRNFITYHYQPN